MSKKILLVRHMVGSGTDRVSQLLGRFGFEVEWRDIYAGEELPAPNGAYAGAVVYGGVQSANDDQEHEYIGRELRWIEDWVGAGKPYLGICLGAQTLARAMGGKVERHPDKLWEIGYFPIQATAAASDVLPDQMHVYHWHNEGFTVPKGGELLASGPTFPQQAFRMNEKVYGFQFHPEVTPMIYARWMNSAGYCLEEPGAHDIDRQFKDAVRYHDPLGDWLKGFMKHWLGQFEG